MSRESKRQKTKAQLRALEGQFLEELLHALRECAAGKLGMLGRNDDVIVRQPEPLRGMLHSRVADRLMQTAENIRDLRDRLGYTDTFPPAERYMQYRAMNAANSPGEPGLAAQFLAELHDRPL